MSETAQGGAPAATEQPVVKEPQVADLDLNKFFGPAAKMEYAPPATPEAPKPEEKPADAAKEPEPKPEPESEIAAAIREMREIRAADAKHKEEANTWKGRFEDLHQEFEAY